MPSFIESLVAAPRGAYSAAVAAVLVALVARFAAQPIFGDNHPYALFVPVVLFCAYALGRGPAIAAAGLSALLAFWIFAEPRFSASLVPEATAPLLVFLATAGVAILVITRLAAAVRSQVAAQDRVRATADANAGLIRDLQARIVHHMTLLVGVLTFQARGEPDPQVLLLLRRAGQRSELIARAHRELAGTPAEEVDFEAFARCLVRFAYEEAGSPEARVEISGGPIAVPTEVATSLGVALSECLAWILKHRPTGTIAVDLRLDDDHVRVWVSLAGQLGEAPDVAAPAAFMFRAMIEQLGAAVRVGVDGPGGAGLEITAPLPSPTLPDHAHATLH